MGISVGSSIAGYLVGREALNVNEIYVVFFSLRITHHEGPCSIPG